MTAMNPIHFDPALPISQKRDEIACTVAGLRTSAVGVDGFLVLILWAGLDSNQRPRDYESPALTD